MNRSLQAAARGIRPGLRSALALAVAAALAGCGGGGSGDEASGSGSGASAAPVAMSFASGTIEGFGSIIVNGVRYDDSSAVIKDETGKVVDSSALKLGMVVDIQAQNQGTSAQGAPIAQASSVQYRSAIEGPLTAIDTARRSLTVLGQTVRITDATVFEDELRGGLAALAVGQTLEVYGLQAADGVYTASRIELEDDDDPYKLRGAISRLDSAARSFEIGGQVISYAAFANLPADLADGSAVRVTLQRNRDGAGRWQAVSLWTDKLVIEVGGDGNGAGGGGNGGSASAGVGSGGAGSSGGSGTSASNGSSAGSGTSGGSSSGGSNSGTGTGGTSGTSTSSGNTSPATHAGPIHAEIEGYISAIVSPTRIVVSGVTVDIAAARRVPADLAVGQLVEVEGRLEAGVLAASSIEAERRLEGGGGFELEGSITSLNTAAQSFQLRGVTVDYAQARFEDGTAARLRIGGRVDVRGNLSADGVTLVATVVELD